MSTKGGTYKRHRFNGDPLRFEAIADYIGFHYNGKVKTIADVAGGQGMLCRILAKKYNFDCEVIDPRGHTLVGVKNRKEAYTKDMADYYDLIVEIHPDEALYSVVASARIRPVIVIPCCNFWSKEEVLGRNALIEKIEEFYKNNGVIYEKVTFDFEGPKNVGLISVPKDYQVVSPK